MQTWKQCEVKQSTEGKSNPTLHMPSLAAISSTAAALGSSNSSRLFWVAFWNTAEKNSIVLMQLMLSEDFNLIEQIN